MKYMVKNLLVVLNVILFIHLSKKLTNPYFEKWIDQLDQDFWLCKQKHAKIDQFPSKPASQLTPPFPKQLSIYLF